MPRPHGNDRVQMLEGGRFRVVSPRAKGWRPARPATRTTAEFPGTTVAWDDSLWEVVSAAQSQSGGASYVLAPWRDQHAIRVKVDYDDASERALATERSKEASRRRMSVGIVAAGLVAGLLPAHVQKGIESEYGILSTRLSLLSLVTQFAFAAIALAGVPIDGLPGPKWPMSVVVAGNLAFAEAGIRSWYCLSRGQPLGAIAGLLFWTALTSVSSRAREFDRATRREADRQRSVVSTRQPDDYEQERDAYALREPFLGLLPPDAQLRLATTFGFDPIGWGIKTAAMIAVVSGAGVGSAISKILDGTSTTGTLLSLALASLLFGEQVKRILDLRRGRPAGSVLGALVSPLCSELLAMQPRAIEKGSTERLERKLPEVWDGNGGDHGDDQTGR